LATKTNGRQYDISKAGGKCSHLTQKVQVHAGPLQNSKNLPRDFKFPTVSGIVPDK